MTSSERRGWDQQAAFMREHDAIAAKWTPEGELLELTLAPKRPTPTAPVEPKAATPKGIAASLLRQHEIQFAHSRVKPPPPAAALATDNDVPRAVAAKKASASRGTKASKRTP